MVTSRFASYALALAVHAAALFTAAPASGQSCRVVGHAAHLEVTVAPPGAPPFALTLDGVAASATPPSSGSSSTIDVDGDLVFRASALDVPYRPDAPVSISRGVAQLGDWSRLATVLARGADVVTTADLGAGVSLASITVPCTALTIDPPPAHPSPLRSPACDATWWTTRGQRVLEFHATPGGASRVRVVLATPRDGFTVCEIEDRGGWLRVANGDSVHVDGGQITGWVQRAALRRIRGGVGFTGGRSMPEPTHSLHRRGVSGAGIRQLRAPVDGGTPVTATRDATAPWATVRPGGATLDVIVRDGDSWVEVASVGGLGAVTTAWIPRSAVHLP